MSLLDDEWDDGTAAVRPAIPPSVDVPPSGGPSRKRRKGAKRDKKAEPKPPPLTYQTLDAFMADYFVPLIRRRLGGGQTWCPAWWRHPEAISRLNAVWRAWEHLQHDPALGMSVWWLHHCGPHLRELMNPDTGPFAACTPEEHTAHPLPPLPSQPPDPTLWLHPAFSAAPAAGAGE